MTISQQVKSFLTEALGNSNGMTEDSIDLPKNQEKINLCLTLIEEEVKELQNAIAEKNIFEIQDAIVDIQWVVNNLPYYMGLDIAKMESAVAMSNFSKFCKTEEDAKETVDLYSKGEHFDKKEIIKTYYEKTTSGLYVIKRKSDDKILKSKDYYTARKCYNRLFEDKVVITYVDEYKPEDCQNNPKKIYIFGDNFQGQGKAGQAIIRDEPNSFGIPTKLSPGKYLSDDMHDQYREEIIRILSDLNQFIRSNLYYDMEIVFPKDGIGTGLARMKTKCPRCFSTLSELLKEFFNIKNPLSTIIKP